MIARSVCSLLGLEVSGDKTDFAKELKNSSLRDPASPGGHKARQEQK
jgi:hypothetical protein